MSEVVAKLVKSSKICSISCPCCAVSMLVSVAYSLYYGIQCCAYAILFNACIVLSVLSHNSRHSLCMYVCVCVHVTE